MANELCASGFGNAVDGQYNLMYKDHWFNGSYWIYRDSYNWMISESEFLYYVPYLVAIKPYVIASWADGHYTGVGANPSGDIVLGVC